MVTDDDVRRVALSLPATTENPSYGTPGFRVKDRLFARIRQEGNVLLQWCWDLDEKSNSSRCSHPSSSALTAA